MNLPAIKKNKSSLEALKLANDTISALTKEQLSKLESDLSAKRDYLVEKAKLDKKEGEAAKVAENIADYLFFVNTGQKLLTDQAKQIPEKDKSGKFVRSVTAPDRLTQKDYELRRTFKNIKTSEDALEALEKKKQEKIKAGKLPVVFKSDFLPKKSHVDQATRNSERYTPKDIIELARSVMGSIDLDPASSSEANKCVKSAKFYDKATDGLKQGWKGNIWLNPPFDRGLIDRFIDKLVNSLETIDQAIVITHNASETSWGQKLLENAAFVCFPKGRINFMNEKLETLKGAPLQGQMICGFKVDKSAFKKEFSKIGVVLCQT